MTAANDASPGPGDTCPAWVADRGYVIRRGSIEIDGSSRELAERLPEIEATYLTGVTVPKK